MIGTRRGFALLAVLWVVTALASLIGLGVGLLRLGQDVSFNRLALTRERWAAEACVAIAQARWDTDRFADTATIDLGRALTCTWRVEDPGGQVNVNTADPDVLKRFAANVGADPAVADTLVARRSSQVFQDTAELSTVPGMTPALLATLTVDGSGAISANAAPAPVLLALPGVTEEAAAALAAHRAFGRPLTSLDALAATLSPPAHQTLLARYADLARTLTFAPALLRMTAVGFLARPQAVTGAGPAASESPSRNLQGLHATIELLVVPLPDRLAVVRQRLW
jgi:type II secretory pathway component PulK